MSVIPAKAGIQGLNQVVSYRKSGTPRTLDSGFRRSDGVVISYAIALLPFTSSLAKPTPTLYNEIQAR